MISCIQPFNHEIPGEKIITDNKSIDWVADEIASRTGLVLTQDRRSPLPLANGRTGFSC